LQKIPATFPANQKKSSHPHPPFMPAYSVFKKKILKSLKRSKSMPPSLWSQSSQMPEISPPPPRSSWTWIFSHQTCMNP